MLNKEILLKELIHVAKCNGKELGIYNIWSFGIDAPAYYFNQKYLLKNLPSDCIIKYSLWLSVSLFICLSICLSVVCCLSFLFAFLLDIGYVGYGQLPYLGVHMR